MRIYSAYDSQIEKNKNSSPDVPVPLELTNQVKLSKILHDKLCRGNHQDSCESWEDSLITSGYYSYRGKYYNMACRILELVNYETAIKIIELL